MACAIRAKGRSTLSPRSPPPHRQQRSGGEQTGLRLSHSTTQARNATASASRRGRPPSNSAIAARSSKKAYQSSANQPSFLTRNKATSAGLFRESRSITSAGGGRAASRTRASPSTRSFTPAARAALRTSAALTASPSSHSFPAQTEGGDLRPHRPHRSAPCISTWLPRTVGATDGRYRPHSRRPSAEWASPSR